MRQNNGFEPIREVLSGLTMHERDFAAGDAIPNRLHDLRRATDELDGAEEPWLVQWLSDEHVKGGILWAAAKLNWSHQQKGEGNAADTRQRASIIQRFNIWTHELSRRLDIYESGPRTAASVAAWRDELARFRQDPVGNS